MTRPSKIDPTLRERLLDHFRILRIPLRADELDLALRQAEQQKMSHLAFVEALIGNQTNQRHERSVNRRIKQASFAETHTLGQFDWEFNRHAIDRLQFEKLGSADFVRRQDNLIFVGQSGIGKSHLIQALGIRACAYGYSVRYTTSADMLEHLTAGLADKTLPNKLRLYTRPALLIIDEFGLDRIERAECKEAASLLYKVVDRRHSRASAALVTNIDFDAWNTYLGDAPLSMALLDRLVDQAIIIKIKKARSFRAARAKNKNKTAQASDE